MRGFGAFDGLGTRRSRTFAAPDARVFLVSIFAIFSVRGYAGTMRAAKPEKSKRAPSLQGRVAASLEGVVLRALARNNSREERLQSDLLSHKSRALLAGLERSGLLRAETVRLGVADSARRCFVVEYAPDPDDPRSILLRITPENGPARQTAVEERMLTTQQAAELLSVSRPYVADLADRGTLRGVLRTQAGHRRIPEVEVLRLREEMRATRRRALDEINEITSQLRAREHRQLLGKLPARRRKK